MLNFYRLAVATVVALILPSSLYGQGERLKFAWPDGASAKVHVRSQGKQVIDSKATPWDASLDFTMQVKRINDRVVVTRNDYSSWKGTFAPPLGAGAEQFVDMVPTLIVSPDGAFIGIEGQETARKLMNEVVEQSGGLSPMERKLFESTLSDASIESMSSQHWAAMAIVWRHVELKPDASYEFRNVAQIPQLGGGELEITGTLKFVKETPCESPRNDQRCIHLTSKTGGDKAQVRKLIQSLLEREKSKPVAITDWDQYIAVDIVVEKKTMLPQYLKIHRFHSLTVNDKRSGQDHTSFGDYATTYTFTWLPNAASR